MTKAPKKWKMAILIWIAIYPTITILLAVFGDHFTRIRRFPCLPTGRFEDFRDHGDRCSDNGVLGSTFASAIVNELVEELTNIFSVRDDQRTIAK